MTFQYCSDLHLEFPINKKYLKANPIKPEGEILLLAGDIVPFAEIEKENDFFNFLSDIQERMADFRLIKNTERKSPLMITISFMKIVARF